MTAMDALEAMTWHMTYSECNSMHGAQWVQLSEFNAKQQRMQRMQQNEFNEMSAIQCYIVCNDINALQRTE